MTWYITVHWKSLFTLFYNVESNREIIHLLYDEFPPLGITVLLVKGVCLPGDSWKLNAILVCAFIDTGIDHSYDAI